MLSASLCCIYFVGASMTLNSRSFVDHLSWEAYNESEDLIAVIKKYRQTYGCYPEAVMVDKLYRNQKNITFYTSKGIRISGPKLGRPKRDEIIDKHQEYKDSGIRNAVEGKFGEGKTAYGLNRIKAKLKETSETVINLAFWVMNINKRLRLLLRFFPWEMLFFKKWTF